MTEQELLIDCLHRLNQAGITYMVTGSMASNYWGIPRSTHDLDFVLQLPPTAIPALTLAFANDFDLDEQMIRTAYQPPHQFNALDHRSGLKLDFWMLKNVPFEREMFSRRQKVSIVSVPAWMASPEDVILHKLYWSNITPSDRQLKDAAGVLAIQRETLDMSYLRDWAKEIGVTETLEDLLAGKIRPKTT
ncbi:MAG: hypothetical protein ABIR24_12670 [Verrucomicrobiota bacterium]